jgi:hypothetical protein
MWVPFSNWQPDLDPVTPGILVDPSDNFVPTRRGYCNSQGFQEAAGQTDLGVPQRGLFYAMRNDGVNNLYAADDAHMYVRVGTSWTIAHSVTISAVATRFQFAQYGDLTFAGALETQSMVTDTTTFSSIAAMPRFAMIDVCNEFVMIGNVAVSITYSDGFGNTMVTPGAYPDRWWCSGISNPFTYQPDMATQATSGRLTDVAGPLTAGRALGDRFVFYKQRGIWLGENTSVPFVWEWGMVSKEVGTWGPQCVVVVDNKHFFLGNDDFYVFDGQKVTPIGAGMREWFFEHASRDYLYKTLGFVDREKKLIYWGYVPLGSATGDIEKYVVFHHENGRWGKSGSFSANVATEFFADAFTYDMLFAGLAYDAAPNTQYDNVAPIRKTWLPAFLRIEDGALVQMHSGPPQDSVLRTSYGGDDTRASLLRRIRARWIVQPDYAFLVPYRLMTQGGAPSPGATVTMTQHARWDFTSHARWHEAEIRTLDSSWETTGVDADLSQRGKE